jgi:hypothetical protein
VKREEGGMKVFWRGVLTGAGIVLAVVLVVILLIFFYERDRRIYEYVKKEAEIEAVREDITHLGTDELLDGVPGVRGAADNADAEFQRKRDELLQRIRNRLAD